jgi:carbon-monoxide dehydrogenase large subunit
VINRVTANSIEPRGCIGEYDRTRGATRCATVQSVHAARQIIADQILKIPQNRLRVVCENMGEASA